MIKSEREIRAAFLSLLRAGLWGSASYCNLGGSNPGSGYFPLTGEEWEIIYLLARRQTVEGLVYDGILRLPVPLLPPSPLLMRWTAEIDGIERQNKQMDGTLGNLNRWLEKKGLKAWLMKGQGVAACYEQPLHRRCGDIDLYFPEPRDAERMIGLLRAEGVVMERQPGMSTLYRHENCQIDQHARLVDIHNPFVSKYISSLIREETGNAILWETGGTSVTLPSPVLAHLISNAHILKHLMAVGVGLRQLCDSARICCRYHECIDGGRLEQIYRKVGIYRWVQGLHRVLVEELGMPESYLPFPLSGSGSRDTRWMKDVWEGGNFGFYDERTGHPASIGRRKRMFGQLAYHLLPQIRYAPAEAFWFPVMQLYSRFNRK